MNSPEKQGCIGLHLQHPVKYVGLNVSLTSLARYRSSRKRYPVEKPSNEILSLKSTDMLQTSNLTQKRSILPALVPHSLILSQVH